MRDPEDPLGVNPARLVVAAIVEDIFHAAVEMDFLGVLRMNHFPRIAEEHPVVGRLDLVAVDEGLLEETKLIVDTVAQRRVVKGRERIEKACRQPSEAAVAEAHVDLGLTHEVEILAQRGERLLRGVKHAGREQIVAEEASHQVLKGEVVNPPNILRAVDRLSLDHPLVHRIADREDSRHPPVVRPGQLGIAGQSRHQMPLDERAQNLHVGIGLRSSVDVDRRRADGGGDFFLGGRRHGKGD